MREKYKLLSLEERKVISKLLKSLYSCHEIGRILKRDKSTILREVKKNGGRKGYDPHKADERARVLRIFKNVEAERDQIMAYK